MQVGAHKLDVIARKCRSSGFAICNYARAVDARKTSWLHLSFVLFLMLLFVAVCLFVSKVIHTIRNLLVQQIDFWCVMHANAPAVVAANRRGLSTLSNPTWMQWIAVCCPLADDLWDKDIWSKQSIKKIPASRNTKPIHCNARNPFTDRSGESESSEWVMHTTWTWCCRWCTFYLLSPRTENPERHQTENNDTRVRQMS